MIFKRWLKSGMSGKDVLYIKQKLFDLGYYSPSINTVLKERFGEDTLQAVLEFQRHNRDDRGNRLTVDGTIGRKTWDAIEAAGGVERGEGIPQNIGSIAASAIGTDLKRVSATRKSLLLAAFSFAYDPAVPGPYPLSLYIRGADLYHADLTLNIITSSRIEAGAKRQPEYYSNGRKEMMLSCIRQTPDTAGADCSGGIVGLLRIHGVVKPSFDTRADVLSGDRMSSPISQKELKPGDWVARSGHIGLYAGGGYVVEWMGGAYGCQLSMLGNRRGFDFVSKKERKLSPWVKFRRPLAY